MFGCNVLIDLFFEGGFESDGAFDELGLTMEGDFRLFRSLEESRVLCCRKGFRVVECLRIWGDCV